MTPGDKSRLIADIVSAEDEARIVDALVFDALASLPRREREDVMSRIQNAIAEIRAHNDDE